MPYFPLQAKLGSVRDLGIVMYKPEKGDVLWIDNIRLDTQGDFCPEPSLLNPWYANGFSPVGAAEWAKTRALPWFKVAGTEQVVRGLQDLKAALPPEATLLDCESRFAELYEDFKKEHPRAILLTLRDGERGYNGWRESFVSCHSPDGADSYRTHTCGKNHTLEDFMRHRDTSVCVGLIPCNADLLGREPQGLFTFSGLPRQYLVVLEPGRSLKW